MSGETPDHLLHCYTARELWNLVFQMFGVEWVGLGMDRIGLGIGHFGYSARTLRVLKFRPIIWLKYAIFGRYRVDWGGYFVRGLTFRKKLHDDKYLLYARPVRRWALDVLGNGKPCRHP
jgi:hypothetical protein